MITVYIDDPRLFLRVLEVLRRRGASFRVPEDPRPKCPESGVVVTDKPELYAGCTRPIVSLENNWEERLEEAICLAKGGDKYNAVIVGIDPGDPPTYVIIADDDLLEKGEAEPPILVEQVRKTLARIPHERAVIRIGDSGEALASIMDSLIHASLKDIRIEIVDEHRTSRSNPRFTEIKDRDVAAAINIAYKKGMRLEATVSSIEEGGGKAQ